MKVKVPVDIKLNVSETVDSFELSGNPAALKAFAQEILSMKEEPEFFDGQLMLGSDNGEDWSIDIFKKHGDSPNNKYIGRDAIYRLAKPYNNPDIIQFRDHKAGDPMPVDNNTWVHCRVDATSPISKLLSEHVAWYKDCQYSPVDGW